VETPKNKGPIVARFIIDRHINNFTALSVGDIALVLSPPSSLVKLIMWRSIDMAITAESWYECPNETVGYLPTGRWGTGNRNTMTSGKTIREFFLPSVTGKFLIRVLLLIGGSYLLFGLICTPMRISGYSMEPTYENGQINFCWKLGFLFRDPMRHDVVAVRLAGNKYFLLKRVVAFPGETVEFSAGSLLIDGEILEEPYLRYPCDWNLSPRKVAPNHVYLVGDNRNVPMEQHDFGQTSIHRIIGTPLW